MVEPESFLSPQPYSGQAKMMLSTMATDWGAPVSSADDVERLRKGDLDALATLIDRYQDRLYRFLLRLVREPATAEDLFQQTWLRVAERIKTYDAQRNFENWLLTVARNIAFDHLRHYRPESLDEPLPSGDARSEVLISETPGAVEAVLAGERAAFLNNAIETLPLIFREVLGLRFEQDLKLEEIAEVLGIPLSTVKSRLRRGLENLRVVLSSKLGMGLEHESTQ
jgi:RNA polymerase sigma-70 factor, ECF subfamily